MHRSQIVIKRFLLGFAAFLLATGARAGSLTVLHQFGGYPTDGAAPLSGVIADSSGNLYGTTSEGGTNYCGYTEYGGCGSVYKVAPDGTESLIHSFSNGNANDGQFPWASLIIDGSNNVYGTTEGGGVYDIGTAFKLSQDGTITVLHSFAGGNDGYDPIAPLVFDVNGNLYSTTPSGGGGRCDKYRHIYYGCGTIFKLTPDGTETVLYAGSTKRDPRDFISGVVIDGIGNLFGISDFDGKHRGGILFELSPQGLLTVFHHFGKGHDGSGPSGNLNMDGEGNLIGTTSGGGKFGVGTIFKFTPSGIETILHSFNGKKNGSDPVGGLIADSSGNLYGAANGGAGGLGIVYKLTPTGKFSILYSFSGSDAIAGPIGPLVIDQAGNLYGVTAEGGAGCGTFGCGGVFKIAQ
ncbi:MAG TPA: choice-of-anchor tandem repeat GloVer-containing protein [Rhizomicrobium sp.]|nr:choice-of-anchor tandem repeat GloVer-containing protein [Rhizomicrobium sp.]